MLHSIAKAVDFLDARLRRRWLALVPLTVLAGALEAVGAGAILALIHLVTDPTQAATLPGVSRVQRFVPHESEAQFVALFALGVGGFYVAKNLLRLSEIYLRQRCSADSTVVIARRLLAGYLAAPYAFHLRRNPAELIRNTTQVAQTITTAILASAISALSELLVVVGILAVVIAASPWSALAAGAVVATLMVGVLFSTQRAHTVWGRRVHDLSGDVHRILRQSLDGVKEVKVLGRDDFFVSRFAQNRASLARIQVFRRVLEFAPRLAIETLFVCGVVALIFATKSRGSAAELVPVLGLFAYAGLRVLPSLHWIVYHLNDIRHCTPAIEDVHRDWVALRLAAPERGDDARPEPLPFTDRIEVRDLAFRYEGSERFALEAVDLEVRRGESIGLVGPTGAGKSTLVDLVLGLLEPTRGRILVDGRDIREHGPAWRRQIGYVPQAIHLSDDSIRRNIALGLEEHEIEEERIQEAARMAQIDEFVHALPDGLDTVVGERGIRLSGGQRQRVAVARALYRDPEVLVFDEATASLDNRTERELAREIESLQRKKTLLIIAHRLSTVRHCDRLVFLRDGRVAEIAPYDELFAECADFRALATSKPA